LGYKIKTTVMGLACGTYGGSVNCIQVFGGKPVRKCHLEDLTLK